MSWMDRILQYQKQRTLKIFSMLKVATCPEALGFHPQNTSKLKSFRYQLIISILMEEDFTSMDLNWIWKSLKQPGLSLNLSLHYQIFKYIKEKKQNTLFHSTLFGINEMVIRCL